MEEYATRIKKLRREKDLTQQDLADALGITKSAISMYERGRRRPNFEVADAMADFFNVSIGYISGSSDIRGSYPRGVGDAVRQVDVDDCIDVRSVEAITQQDLNVLEAYRNASEEIQNAVKRVLGVR